jgi:uncharacterized repeat protein (TIGR03803 family)
MIHAILPRRNRRWAEVATALAAVLLAGAGVPAYAAKVADLYDFGVTDNQRNPGGYLTLGEDGRFYGEEGFTGTSVVIFEMSPQGKETALWSGPGYPDQAICTSGLTLGADGLLYGTCSIWNNNLAAGGAIFRFNPRKPTEGLKALYVFPPVNSQGSTANPSHLTLGTDGNLYGTAWSGYSGDANANGSVFRITPKGQFTTLYTFQGGLTDGNGPNGLTLASDGNFYGVTRYGGAAQEGGPGTQGMVYRITPAGAETILATFTNDTDGENPVGPLTQGNDGNFYGSTYNGGADDVGTLFRMTPAGQITYLHDFSQSADGGDHPTFQLAQSSDGDLYGSTNGCAPNGCGTANLFRLTLKGRYTTEYVFPPPCANCEDIPSSPLTQDPVGGLYGLTEFGGPNDVDSGTFYRLTVGAPPFVALQSPIGAVGYSLGILGKGFKGATAVAFNGVPAAYTVVNDTYLTATVPAGATAGFVTVTEPGGTLKSAVVFTPQ